MMMVRNWAWYRERVPKSDVWSISNANNSQTLSLGMERAAGTIFNLKCKGNNFYSIKVNTNEMVYE